MAAITTRKIEAIVHTKFDAARRRTVAKTIALDRLSAFLGDAAPALQPPALPWVDLEIRPAFREPVEICVDCPEKATESTAFKVRFPRLARRLPAPKRPRDVSRRWRERQHVCSMVSSGRQRQHTGPGPARARGGLARGATSRARLLRPRPRPRRGRRRGGARKSFGAVRARRHVGAARGLGRAAAPQSAEGLARLRRRAASKVQDHVRRAGVASMA